MFLPLPCLRRLLQSHPDSKDCSPAGPEEKSQPAHNATDIRSVTTIANTTLGLLDTAPPACRWEPPIQTLTFAIPPTSTVTLSMLDCFIEKAQKHVQPLSMSVSMPAGQLRIQYAAKDVAASHQAQPITRKKRPAATDDNQSFGTEIDRITSDAANQRLLFNVAVRLSQLNDVFTPEAVTVNAQSCTQQPHAQRCKYTITGTGYYDVTWRQLDAMRTAQPEHIEDIRISPADQRVEVFVREYLAI